MPTLSDACNVTARIFDPMMPTYIYCPSSIKTDLSLAIMGMSLLFVKDFFDEYRLERLTIRLNRGMRVMRWVSYIALIILILMTGVLSADQIFIYANF